MYILRSPDLNDLHLFLWNQTGNSWLRKTLEQIITNKRDLVYVGLEVHHRQKANFQTAQPRVQRSQRAYRVLLIANLSKEFVLGVKDIRRNLGRQDHAFGKPADPLRLVKYVFRDIRLSKI